MTEDEWFKVERIRAEAMSGKGRLLTEEEEDLCRNAYKEDGPRYINIGVALREEYAEFLRGG